MTRLVKSIVVEALTERIVFASVCRQELHKPEGIKNFVDDIRAIGPEGEAMLSSNVGLLSES
ncbi:MAG: hypothetical protein ACI9JL_001173 [Paracoccaceae bacterium]